MKPLFKFVLNFTLDRDESLKGLDSDRMMYYGSTSSGLSVPEVGHLQGTIAPYMHQCYSHGKMYGGDCDYWLHYGIAVLIQLSVTLSGLPDSKIGVLVLVPCPLQFLCRV